MDEAKGFIKGFGTGNLAYIYVKVASLFYILQPAVCARELCVFAFQTLGVMSDAADDIATGPEVIVEYIKLTLKHVAITYFSCRGLVF